ncbi:MAG: hypothetical protein OWU84_12515 [Firmicutes bacterium]|nr:hypothetical protein [Bacillota bacterium]
MSRILALTASGALVAFLGASPPWPMNSPRTAVAVTRLPSVSPRTLVLSPASGPPGTRVTVTGVIPTVRHLTPSQRKKLPPVGNIQFGGLQAGLDIEGVPLTWSTTDPGEYRMTFRVPRVPWLTIHGEHPLVAGRYAITVTCVGPLVDGCDSGPAEARGMFTLTGPIAVKQKTPFLRFSPDRGSPGTLIRVSGWAPLTSIIGQPFGYQLVWNPGTSSSPNTTAVMLHQSLSGVITGSFQVPADVEPAGPLNVGKNILALSDFFIHLNETSIPLAPTPFTILPPTSWASLGRFRPLSVTTNQDTASFGQPSPVAVNGSTVGVATTPGLLWIRVQSEWRAISVGPIAALSQAAGYPTVYSGADAPRVSSLTFVKGYPQSIFVAVSAANAQYGSIPPVYNTPYYSTNLGQSWKTVPVPHGYTPGDFGGFVTEGSALAAYFTQGTHWVSETTQDGGRTWAVQRTPLPPVSEPPLQWGPMANAAFGQMGPGNAQTVLRMLSPGHWAVSASFTNLTGTTTLAALTARKALLIEPDGAYPLQVTQNSGKTWTDVALPVIPGALGEQVLGMLSNGTLLAQVSMKDSSAPFWYILRPGARGWANVPASVIPPQTFGVTIDGSDVWWIKDAGSASVPPTLAMVDENRL